MSNKFVVIDLETTGNTPKKGSRIIQIGAVVIENGKISGQFSSLVNPEQPIPLFIEELTGINEEMVEEAPLFSEIAPHIAKLLKDAYFVAHNVFFDLAFLQDELINAGVGGFYGPVLDTVELARVMLPTADSFKLTDLALAEGLRHDRPHQADSDAFVTAELMLILLEKINMLPMVTLKSLEKLSTGLKSDVHLLFEAALLGNKGKIENLPGHLEVFRGIALRKQVDTDTPVNVPDMMEYPQTEEAKQQALQRAFAGYEKRTGQFQMMDVVFDAFNRESHALIEAGTGVGKSLAYLIPAAVFAKNHAKPVMISTFTTQLQEQLLLKDIPLLKKIMPLPLNTALLKGRQHYISLAKFEQSLREEDDNYDTTLSKMQILVWLTSTEIGDYDELNLSSGGAIYWSKIKNDVPVFLQNEQWKTRDFYYRARKAAETADVIITNHSLLLTDLVSDHSFLPPYDYVVLDEGHHFGDAAAKYFGKVLDYMAVRLSLNQIGLYEQGQLFYKLETLLAGLEKQAQDMKHAFEINQLLADLQYETDELFKLASLYARKEKKNKPFINRINCRLSPEMGGKQWSALLGAAERFYFIMKDFLAAMQRRLDHAGQQSSKLTAEQKAFLEELSVLLEDLALINRNVKELFFSPSSEYVRWIETDVRAVQNATTVYAQPVSVSGYLREQFFSMKKSVVITSATLSVKNSFDFIKRDLGIDGLPCMINQIASPFSYEKQVQLIVPKDLPEIKAVKDDEYIAAITEQIISVAEATKGRMLILFTSHDMLKKTYELIKESGLLEDFALIAQGISGGSRTRLTRNFQRFEKAILFGTSSFWEGVDIPGEDLSCLIIVRLPFSPPDEPLTEAKCEQIRKAGGNPFSDHALPEAVLRFKQGFGRLVRTSTDRGIIIVFDRRLLTSSYGKAFLDSVPNVPVKQYSIDETVDLIQSWL
ncbi:ATP-dependent DNA helicase DinG [Bacillus sp. T33-2]|uniref:ATP-dependent DNA helicase DinG n=1 Tax=Bacillus sp. T33-2 TaxID=2054168 RepID=UPI000C761C9C|nr:ATP-dependent DNA helicase DinG [Bacillus sp. T33-2]PLR99718.1 ATP-dependent helicase DinG [Bacillus sp. T33-2]